MHIQELGFEVISLLLTTFLIVSLATKLKNSGWTYFSCSGHKPSQKGPDDLEPSVQHSLFNYYNNLGCGEVRKPPASFSAQTKDNFSGHLDSQKAKFS